ncbi:MAG: hypothetical protein QXF56_03440 [Candidatus Micrarchaeia archaeon]
MVFGIGEGRIEITLDRVNYSLGDTVKGTVKLELKSPKKAKELRVRLWGERTRSKSGKHSGGKEIVHEFTLRLDGEKEYSSGEYPFEIALPKLPEPKLEGKVGDILGVAQTLGLVASPPRWYIKATLDLPMSIDISKTIQLNVV